MRAAEHAISGSMFSFPGMKASGGSPTNPSTARTAILKRKDLLLYTGMHISESRWADGNYGSRRVGAGIGCCLGLTVLGFMTVKVTH